MVEYLGDELVGHWSARSPVAAPRLGAYLHELVPIRAVDRSPLAAHGGRHVPVPVLRPGVGQRRLTQPFAQVVVTEHAVPQRPGPHSGPLRRVLERGEDGCLAAATGPDEGPLIADDVTGQQPFLGGFRVLPARTRP